jgi:hypothetical protein
MMNVPSAGHRLFMHVVLFLGANDDEEGEKRTQKPQRMFSSQPKRKSEKIYARFHQNKVFK